MEGVVIRSTGSWYTVRTDQGDLVACNLKGRFRIKGIKTTSPVAVGDRVAFEIAENQESGMITRIFERKNYIIRKATKLSKQAHIIGANVDRVVIVVTMASPRTSTGFIDRVLVTAEAYHIPAYLIFNKIDLYDTDLWEYHKQIRGIYESAGYSCMEVSALKKQNLDAVQSLLSEGITLLSGHSGVGKSALINALEPQLQLKTASISTFSNKGRHTTTYAEMHPLSFGGYIIDTPGIKGFGLTDFKKEEVAERFPEMRAIMHDCQFSNCTHVHEPQCAVKAAVQAGLISAERYNNYLSIYHDEYFELNDWE